MAEEAAEKSKERFLQGLKPNGFEGFTQGLKPLPAKEKAYGGASGDERHKMSAH